MLTSRACILRYRGILHSRVTEKMIILGIETSCDETSVGIVEDGTKLLGLSTLSSLKLHAETGGIIPEIAAREQVKAMIPALNQALEQAFGSSSPNEVKDKIDAIAVTYGPGLIGSLLVGIETARTLSYLWNKPLIPVNHLLGHVYSASLTTTPLPAPLSSERSLPSRPSQAISDHSRGLPISFVALVVSGGHTDLLHFENNKYQWLGGTLDDAAGECLDKVGRLLGIPYPAGPTIDKLAKEVANSDNYSLPRPLINADNYDFSFSGLKTSAVYKVQKNPEISSDKLFLSSNENKKSLRPNGLKTNFLSSLQEAIIDILIKKSVNAARAFKTKNIVVGGGVSANSRLRERFEKEFDGNLFFPEVKLSGDNGAMIAAAAYFQNQPLPWQEVKPNPSLYFD